MIELEINTPHNTDFFKQKSYSGNQWSSINYLVGPNCTGKSTFLDLLSLFFKYNYQYNFVMLDYTRSLAFQKCFSVFHLEKYAENFVERMQEKDLFNNQVNTDEFIFDIINLCRNTTKGLSHWPNNKGDYLKAFDKLEENIELLEQINNFLSKCLNKKIDFHISTEKPYKKPYISLNTKEKRYNGNDACFPVIQWESLGLKQLIILLTYIYDKEIDILLIDEPELNLHPSLQMHLMQEIRNVAGDFTKNKEKKMFFIATHSPFILDIRTFDELKYGLMYFKHKDELPRTLEASGLEEKGISAFLLRLNSHYKQFLFTPTPIFVEGVYDELIFSRILEKTGFLGQFFYAVNGKQEMIHFYKICNSLDIKAKFICDLDAFIEGKLKNEILDIIDCKETYNTFINKIEGIETKKRLENLKLLTCCKNSNQKLNKEFNSIISKFEEVGCFFLSKGSIEDYLSIKNGKKLKPSNINEILDDININETDYKDLSDFLNRVIEV